MNNRNTTYGKFRPLAPVGLIFLSAMLGVLLSEVAARLVVDPADFLHATLVEDPILNHRILPGTTGHDALGFRNRAVPARADIVALGDSMTYGVGVTRDGSWPQQLGVLLGEQVYNMGLGGYGPLQYLHLARSRAPALKPRLVIVGFYYGNDMMDALYVARGLPHWHGWRVSVDARAEETDYDRAGQAEPKKRLRWLRDWLARNSVLYSMLRVTVLPRFHAIEQDSMARNAEPDVRMLWHDAANPAVRTIFTSRVRLAAVDLSSKPVGEGMQIAQRALVELKAEAERQGFSLLVALIPTKERAYCRYLGKAGDRMPASFIRLCEAESSANAQLTQFLAAQGISFVDVTPALELHIDGHAQLYPTDADGHPAAAGYAVIAREIAATVRRGFPRQ